MTLSISISPEAEAKLKERAAAAGEDLPTYAAQVLEQAVVRQPTLDEILAPLRKEFAESGTTDEQLIEQINQARQQTPQRLKLPVWKGQVIGSLRRREIYEDVE